jgi:hypothetical protein
MTFKTKVALTSMRNFLNKLRLALGFAAILGTAPTAFAIDSTLESQAKIRKSAAEEFALSKTLIIATAGLLARQQSSYFNRKDNNNQGRPCHCFYYFPQSRPCC